MDTALSPRRRLVYLEETDEEERQGELGGQEDAAEDEADDVAGDDRQAHDEPRHQELGPLLHGAEDHAGRDDGADHVGDQRAHEHVGAVRCAPAPPKKLLSLHRKGKFNQKNGAEC